MVKAPKTTKPKTTKPKAAPKAAKTADTKPKLAVVATAARKSNGDGDEENRKLFVGTYLPNVKDLRAKVATAVSNLRKAYKTAKSEAGFTKADFDTAISIEDIEAEARTKARIARQLQIARYMGKSLGAQLDMFMEPDRTPSSDIAYDEGKIAAMEGRTARPDYHPSTEQHRRYMEGFHAVTEDRVKSGIKTLEPKTPEEAIAQDEAQKEEAAEAIASQKQADAAAFEGQTSGIPTSRSQFLKQQAAEPTADSVFAKTKH